MFTFILKIIVVGSILSACAATPNQEAVSQGQTFPPGVASDFTFQSSDLKLSGIFDTPAGGNAEALILFVHGYGPSNVREWNSYADLRARFNDIGIATAVWDKPGQGRSAGTFDINQSVYGSAQEVVDAAQYFRDMNAPGAQKIGIWGISRAGWIAPIAMSEDEDIDFWISVSGTTAEDNFPYLLLSNLPYEGGTAELAQLFAEEWREGCKLFRTGGSFEAYQSATQNLRANQYIIEMRGPWRTREQYETQQQSCEAGSCTRVDDDMCSYVFIEDFDAMLSSLDLDVLAIFGERDLNIDWRKTQTAYQATIGNNADASLEVHTFARADHNLHIAETGSIREMNAMTSAEKADGYYDVQLDWLQSTVLASEDE